MGRRLRPVWGWVGRHSVALDAVVVCVLAFTLIVNLPTYVNGPPWGWFAGGFLGSALCVRIWALAWAKGYAKAAAERRDTIAQQAAALELQREAFQHAVPLTLPAIVLDKETGQVTVRMFISPN